MRNILIIINLLFVFGLSVKAQDTALCDQDSMLNATFESKLTGEVYRYQSGMIGKQFFNDDYIKGDIVLQNGEIVSNKLLRYNGRIDGLLMWSFNGSKEILLDKNIVQGFCLKDYQGIPSINFRKITVKLEFKNDSTDIFAQLLYQNKLSLYVFRRFILQEKRAIIIEEKKFAEKIYGPSFIYYFKFSNNRTIGFKSFKKRDLYDLFPDKKDLMQKLFREHHQRRFRTEEDIVRITEILNSIIK